MAADKCIGHVVCQACGEQAEVRTQKNGRAYTLCQHPDCGFQGFTRSASADAKLRAKMTPKAAAPAAEDSKIVDRSQQKTRTAPTTTAPKKGFFDGIL